MLKVRFKVLFPKMYAVTAGFGLSGVVFLTIAFDSYRLAKMGDDPSATLNGSAIYAVVLVSLSIMLLRALRSRALAAPLKTLVRVLFIILLGSVVCGTVYGLTSVLTGVNYVWFAKAFIFASVGSSFAAVFWLAKYRRWTPDTA